MTKVQKLSIALLLAATAGLSEGIGCPPPPPGSWLLCCGETVCDPCQEPEADNLGEFRCYIFFDGFESGDAHRWEEDWPAPVARTAAQPTPAVMSV